MQNLLTIEIYEFDETGYWARMSLREGASFGVMFGILMFLTVMERAVGVRSLLFLIGASGVLFGFAMSRFLRAEAAKTIVQIWTGEAEVWRSVPQQRNYSWYVVCQDARGAWAAWTSSILQTNSGNCLLRRGIAGLTSGTTVAG